MKNTKFILGALAIVILSAFTTIQSINWKLKEDAYAVAFKGTKVNGMIKGLKTTIQFDEAKPENSQISASLDVNTVNTGNGMMNKHAKSADGLDAKKYGTITFQSTSVSRKGSAYTAVGKLTIKDVTKEINLPFTFETAGAASVFKGKFTITPKDFHITRGGTPETLEIDIIAPVTK